MEGRIKKDGSLVVWRKTRFAGQGCPYKSADKNGVGAFCGDWCPQFGEHTQFNKNRNTILMICQGRELFFDKFTDERE